jgi:hypothetical protein
MRSELLIQTERQTDTRDETNVFRKFAETPRNYIETNVARSKRKTLQQLIRNAYVQCTSVDTERTGRAVTL